MIVVKTDWKATDRYNVSDYERQTGNLTRVCMAVGIQPPEWETLTLYSIDNLYLACQQLLAAYAFLLPYSSKGWPPITYQERWLLWSECNHIEGLCLEIAEKYGLPSTHQELSAYTHAELSAYTHQEIKGGI